MTSVFSFVMSMPLWRSFLSCSLEELLASLMDCSVSFRGRADVRAANSLHLSHTSFLGV